MKASKQIRYLNWEKLNKQKHIKSNMLVYLG
jgi:hypothetical protein